MKISPVAGTPTIQQQPNTGVAPDKLAKAKARFAGEIVPEPTEEDKEKLLAAAQTKITMQTNKTPEKVGIPTEEVVPPELETGTSDASVQTKEGSEVTQPLSPQLAALARQRRALQVKEGELNGKIEAAKSQALAEYKAKLKSNALSVLLEEGVSYDQLTQEILGNQSQTNPKIEALEAEIKALKEGVDTRFSEAQIAQEASAINYVADKLDALMATGDDFDLIKAVGEDAEQEIVRRVYNHWKKTGKELSVAETAKAYQEELADEAARYANIKQVQGKLTPAEPAPVTPTTQQTGMRTLTNKDSARPAMDRRQRAILAMQGQLKR